jgi:kinesin family protein C1
MSKKDSNVEAEIQLQELSKEHVATTAQLNAINGEFESLKMQSKFESDIRERKWNDEKDKMMFEISVLKSRVATSSQEKRSDAVTDEDDTAILKARIEEKNRRIAELEAEILKGEQIRRNMHNRIQELRGNIRVYVRTRPFLPADGDSKSSCIDILGDGESLAITDPRNKEPSAFKFDKVFPPSAGQDCVFQEVSDFVQSALDGYNVCLFSYGQTGSGKTHTMQGSGTGVMRGIIPRAVEQILGQIKNLQNCRWKYQMTASFLEIYNEDLRDLLHCLNVSSVRGTGKSDDLKANKLTIRRHQEGRSYVEGLSEVEIDCSDFTFGMEKIKSVIVAASRARSVATTKMNEVSSRSHSVFILNISGLNEDDGTIVKGTLNLCDLAGSERLDRSGAISDTQRLKETQSINKSLSCLGDVFNALGQGAAHVPFRNSKLTYLLQDCLSGDGKALMFVNLSPTFESVGESLCSLRFAQRVNQVELGKATKNVQYHNKGSQKK